MPTGGALKLSGSPSSDPTGLASILTANIAPFMLLMVAGGGPPAPTPGRGAGSSLLRTAGAATVVLLRSMWRLFIVALPSLLRAGYYGLQWYLMKRLRGVGRGAKWLAWAAGLARGRP